MNTNERLKKMGLKVYAPERERKVRVTRYRAPKNANKVQKTLERMGLTQYL